jgi:hypothetical protein
MSVAEWITLAAGPAGGLLVSLAVLYGGYRILIHQLIPLAHKHLEDVDARWREQMESHLADRDQFKMSVRSIRAENKGVAEKIESVSSKVDDIKSHLGV